MQEVGAAGCKMVSDTHGIADDCNLRVTVMKCHMRDGGFAQVKYFSEYINTSTFPAECVMTLRDSGFRSEEEDKHCTTIGQNAEESPKLWVFGKDDVSKDQAGQVRGMSLDGATGRSK